MLELDNKEFKATVTVTNEQMRKYVKYIKKRNKHYLAEPAVATMHIGVKRFWSKHYNLRSGQTSQLALFNAEPAKFEWAVGREKYKGQPTLIPSKNDSNFRSRNGNKRLVSFSWGKSKRTGTFIQDELSIHSFPMNLYEENVVLGGWASGTIRKGTHIMRSLLTPEAQKQLTMAAARYQAELEEFFRRENV